MLRHETHEYKQFQYPEDHWALDPTKEGACLALVKFRDKYNYAINLNPTDRRGYRSLIIYMGENNCDIYSTFNRQYTLAEQRGLSDVTNMMMEIYKRLGLPIVQSAQAGNNSHSLDKNTGKVQIGSPKEPCRLHNHVWARGDRQFDYIPGVPLEGPEPGKMFDMMAQTPIVPGNESKVLWEPDQFAKGLIEFTNGIHAYVKSDEFKAEFSESIKVTIFQPGLIIDKQSSFYAGNNAGVNLIFTQGTANNTKLIDEDVKIKSKSLQFK